MTVVLLTACGDTLPATEPDKPDASSDGGVDASTGDAAVDDAPVPPGDLDAASICEMPSTVTVPTGCAAPDPDAAQPFIECTTFDNDTEPLNAAVQSNGEAGVSSAAISPPNGVTVTTSPGISQVDVSSEVGPIAFDHAALEADVRLAKLGTRFVLGEITVSQSIGGTQVIELWVEEDGTLSVAASLSNAGFADAGASAKNVTLCPNRWSHVKLALEFEASEVHIAVSLDGKTEPSTLPSHISPAINMSSAIGQVGVRTVELGSGAVTLDVDNMQLYIH